LPPTADDTPNDTSTSHPPIRKGKLLQILGIGFGIAVAVGNTISAGIVRTPGTIAALLPSVPLFFSVWILGLLYALVSAFQISELGAAIPKSGGQYNFARRALGDYAGFIVGWSDWLSTCGSCGAVGIVIGEYMAHLFPVFDSALKIKIIAVGAIAIFALLQWKSLRMGSKIQNFTTVLKGLVFFAIVIA